MSDLEKWANTNDNDLYDIAKTWAKRYTTKKLRGLQSFYTESLPVAKHEDKPGLQKMWQCATLAIDIREFGEN